MQVDQLPVTASPDPNIWSIRIWESLLHRRTSQLRLGVRCHRRRRVATHPRKLWNWVWAARTPIQTSGWYTLGRELRHRNAGRWNYWRQQDPTWWLWASDLHTRSQTNGPDSRWRSRKSRIGIPSNSTCLLRDRWLRRGATSHGSINLERTTQFSMLRCPSFVVFERACPERSRMVGPCPKYRISCSILNS